MTILKILFLGLTILNAQNPTLGKNYIISKQPLRPYKSFVEITGKPADSVRTQIIYFDGLGRPAQIVGWQASPLKKDLIQYFEYDSIGMERFEYLPYADQSGNTGSFKSNAKLNQSAYYSSGSWDVSVTKTSKPYAETIYENNTLKRIKQQGFPGEAWQPSNTRGATGRTLVYEYSTNLDDGIEGVKLWKIKSGNSGAESIKNYPAGSLYKTTYKDENWMSGKSGIREKFIDFKGQLVLNRVWKNDTKKIDTYYVYDDFGNLRYVIPPIFPGNIYSESDLVFKEQIYAYKYDSRQRLVEKKIPGKGWEFIVYNKNDQIVLTQDSMQRSNNKWMFFRTDALLRTTSIGIYSNPLITSRIAMQQYVNSHAGLLYENRNGDSSYSTTTFPTIEQGTTISYLVINYYDDYNFKPNGLLETSVQSDTSSNVKTLLTGRKTFKYDGSSPLLSVFYYDDFGRLIQLAEQNHLSTTGTDYVTNTYNFIGELVNSKREHTPSSTTNPTNIIVSYKYDHVGRIKDVLHQMNSDPKIILSRNEYNEIGQLKSKKLHSVDNGTTFLSNINYSFNERGWITGSSSPQFSFQLNYNSGINPQYNGNIAQQLWGHGASTPNTFNYTYDSLNQLTKASSTGVQMYERLEYDDMGNIKKLVRNNQMVSDTASIN